MLGFDLRAAAPREEDPMPQTTRAPALLTALAVASACAPPAPGGDDDPSAATTGAGTTAADPAADTTGAPPPAEPLPDPFALNREQVRLLPFAIRFKRLQQLVGLPESDPAFDVMRARRYELGDYNHALGISPDLTWTATRMQAWIAALRPVCNAAAMQARFPGFPEHLDDLLTAAYGDAPSAGLLASYEDLLGDAQFDDATRYELVCLAALGSLEFVAQ